MHISGRKFSPHRSRRLLLQPRIRCCDRRARHSIDRHTVSSMPPSFLAVLARLTMRLLGFVTNPRERCGLSQRPEPACRGGASGGSDTRSLSDIAVRDEADEALADARPQATKSRRRIHWNTLRIFRGRERRRWPGIVRRSRRVKVGQAPGWRERCASQVLAGRPLPGLPHKLDPMRYKRRKIGSD